MAFLAFGHLALMSSSAQWKKHHFSHSHQLPIFISIHTNINCFSSHHSLSLVKTLLSALQERVDCGKPP